MIVAYPLVLGRQQFLKQEKAQHKLIIPEEGEGQFILLIKTLQKVRCESSSHLSIPANQYPG